MGRKVKYSKELKIEIVQRYLSGESASLLANEYNMKVEQIRHFLKKRKCFLFDYKIVYER